MSFCQLAQAKSLREIEQGLAFCEGRLHNLGLEEVPARSTLSDAIRGRPASLFEDAFYSSLRRCQGESPRRSFRFKSKLLSLDSTVLELCASMFDRTRYRRTKGAAKFRLVLEHFGCLSVFAHIREGAVSEVVVAQEIHFPPGSIVVMDRGYNDYRLFETWCEQNISFVPRLKTDAEYFS